MSAIVTSLASGRASFSSPRVLVGDLEVAPAVHDQHGQRILGGAERAKLGGRVEQHQLAQEILHEGVEHPLQPRVQGVRVHRLPGLELVERGVGLLEHRRVRRVVRELLAQRDADAPARCRDQRDPPHAGQLARGRPGRHQRALAVADEPHVAGQRRHVAHRVHPARDVVGVGVERHGVAVAGTGAGEPAALVGAHRRDAARGEAFGEQPVRGRGDDAGHVAVTVHRARARQDQDRVERAVTARGRTLRRQGQRADEALANVSSENAPSEEGLADADTGVDAPSLGAANARPVPSDDLSNATDDAASIAAPDLATAGDDGADEGGDAVAELERRADGDEDTIADTTPSRDEKAVEQSADVLADGEAGEASSPFVQALRMPAGIRASSREFGYVDAMPASWEYGGGGLMIEGSAAVRGRFRALARIGAATDYQEFLLGGSWFLTPPSADRMTVVLTGGIETGRFELDGVRGGRRVGTELSDTGLYLGAASRFVVNRRFELQAGLGYSSFFEGDPTLFGGGYFHVGRQLDIVSRVEVGDNDSLGIGVRYYY